jgi:curved DNA-binding protein CbpA
MIEVERYYRILDLEPGASPEEVDQGYLDLAWVWHPDRFPRHSRLQKKATYKLQELNEAHEQLRSFRPTPQTRDLRAKSKPQASPPSQEQAAAKDLHEPEVDHDNRGYHKKTFHENRRPVSFSASDVAEWLD